MNFRLVSTSDNDLCEYRSLFKKCFPKSDKFTLEYLKWLYTENPEGKVVGFDAYDGTTLAAHYACIPVKIRLHGEITKVLLSLNTATHPDYQGKGLFTTLAKMTYDYGKQNSFSAVFGIANANSTPGFLKRLNFTLISPLQAKIGFGKLGIDNWDEVNKNSEFKRVWTKDSFLWRIKNPSTQTSFIKNVNGFYEINSASGTWPFRAYCEIDLENAAPDMDNYGKRFELNPRIFIGIFPENTCKYKGYISLPDRLKPSPLNFIFLPLNDSISPVSDKKALINYIDFDAY